MTNLSSSSNEELLGELQKRLGAGVFAATPPDADSSLYYWWGPRVHALGLTARLTHSLNVELEDDSEDVEGEDESDESDESPDDPFTFGNYL